MMRFELPSLGADMDDGTLRSDSAIVPVSVPCGSTRSVKLRFGASTGFPTTNGFTLPESGVILLSVASEKGFAWAS